MTEEQFDKWVTALESGKYRQRRTSLYGPREDGETSYCCLGVMAKVLGIGDDKGNLFYPKLPSDLEYRYTRRNDIERLSFAEIAKFARAERDEFLTAA